MKFLVFVFLILSYAYSASVYEDDSSANNELSRNILTHPARRPAKPKIRIIGGRDAVPHAYPYQAALLIDSIFKTFLCGGSLITRTQVLTAAHCLDGAIQVNVILGAHDLRFHRIDGSIIYTSSDFILHDGWDPDLLKDDIAIIKLPKPVNLSSNIQLTNIATNDSPSYENEVATLTGWGLTSNYILDSPSKLQVLEDLIQSNSKCRTYPKFSEVVRDTHLCLSGSWHNDMIGSCSGDSGGPLVVNGTQVGIVSFGSSICGQGLPSVFTRVSSYYQWIKKHSNI